MEISVPLHLYENFSRRHFIASKMLYVLLEVSRARWRSSEETVVFAATIRLPRIQKDMAGSYRRVVGSVTESRKTRAIATQYV